MLLTFIKKSMSMLVQKVQILFYICLFVFLFSTPRQGIFFYLLLFYISVYTENNER